MEEHEESEIVQDMGQVARVILGSGMQAAEQLQRQTHLAIQERAAQASRERAMIEQIRRDFSSTPFWKNTGSESIADRMTIAAELATRHPEAARAYVDGADRIRNQFGINVEDINRDHPTAPADRHAALRDALDDHYADKRLDAESQKTPNADKDAGNEPKAGSGTHRALADTTQADTAEAATARQDETANLDRAEQAGTEAVRDQKNAQGQEATEASIPGKPVAGWSPGDATPGAAQALKSWREHTGGKHSADFPHEPRITASDVAMTNRKQVIGAQQPQRVKEKVQAR